MRHLDLKMGWRPGLIHPHHGTEMLLHPGRYRVPEDMSNELADRAVAEGTGAFVEVRNGKAIKGAPENKA